MRSPGESPKLASAVAASVVAAANRNGLEPALVAAVTWKESTGVPWKERFEPGWSYFCTRDGKACNAEDVRGAEDCSNATERVLQATGLGLMQVQGTVARELGFRGPFLSQLLHDQDLGLEYGCRKLSQLRKRFELEDAVSAYNAGPGGVGSNPGYVAAVMGFYAHFRAKGL